MFPKRITRREIHSDGFRFSQKNVMDLVIKNRATGDVLIGRDRFPIESGENLSLGNPNTVEDIEESFQYADGATGKVYVYWTELVDESQPSKPFCP